MRVKSQVSSNNLSEIHIPPARMDSQRSADEGDTESLDSLKALTEKLKLETRRPSYLEWQERLLSGPWRDKNPSTSQQHDRDHSASTQSNPDVVARNICGFDTIDDALNFLRKELVSEVEELLRLLYCTCTHRPLH